MQKKGHIFEIVEPNLLQIKLMGLGVTNRMVDDSDFKWANFDCRFRSDWDFNNDFDWTIAISIKI